jgi:alpha-N-arabinofuranosidase
VSHRIVIDVGQPLQRIDRSIYGHFIEHIGSCIYGGLWVGEDSRIPNTRGIRNDVVAALRRIKVPVLRWPGGCFADEYHWRDGVGPRQKRPRTVNTHWGGVIEDNAFGTHEFLDICSQLDCEPYICGNVGSGTVQEMSDWVAYLNSEDTEMAAQRRANGLLDPAGVVYWGIGNENWGCGGRMRAEYYADLCIRYSLYSRDYGEHKLYRIACGPNSDDYHWTEVLMRECNEQYPERSDTMHGLALHYYAQERVPGTRRRLGSATRFEEAEWFRFLELALHMENLVRKHGAIMDRYDPEKRIALIVDEWGSWYSVEPGTNPAFNYQQNTMRDALIAGVHLNIFNNHSDRVRMANIAQMVNVLQSPILTEPDGERIVMTPTFYVYEMYSVHQDARLLPLTLDEGDYEMEGRRIPKLTASASRVGEGTVNLSICNTDPRSSAEINVQLQGGIAGSASAIVLAEQEMTAHNTFDEPSRVRPRDLPVRLSEDRSRPTVTLPAMSVATITMQP